VGAPDVEGLPWPKGEPAPLHDAASTMSSAAAQLGSLAGRITSSGGGVLWTGLAFSACDFALQSQAQSTQGSAAVMSESSDAVSALADLLTSGQNRVKALASTVREARLAAAHAQSQIDGMPANIRAHDPDFASLAGAAASAQRHYEEVRAQATQQAQQICHEIEAADRSTAAQLNGAKSDATGGLGGLPAGPGAINIEPVALAWEYAPHLRFHPDETAMPEDIRKALDASTVKVNGDGQLYLDIPNDLRNGTSWKAPIDTNIVTKGGKKYLVYRVFYGFNPKTFDHHEGDVELFSVQLDKNDKPTAALYYTHGAANRVDRSKVAKEPGADGRLHPILYPASGSHAGYPDAGHHPIAKFLGIPAATDETADGGARASAESNLRIGPDRYSLTPEQLREASREADAIPSAGYTPAALHDRAIHDQVERELQYARDHGGELPPGTRIGESGSSPQAPNTGANAEPYPDGKSPHDGAPPDGDGADKTILKTLEDAGAGDPVFLP